ncbi:MAG: GNAT family N-acetyltransferase, partial [Candidatus Eisenbacteria bacterium]|nr:GNAT family N-acetyltransferase [Candidatus Eisenbacteria bacterium]
MAGPSAGAVRIERIHTLDHARLRPLVERSLAEDYRMLHRLEDEWKAGTNRFDREGEALFVALISESAGLSRATEPSATGASDAAEATATEPSETGASVATDAGATEVGAPAGMTPVRWLGIAGINKDPYTDVEGRGRLRHLYVLPEVRKHGIGRQLVDVVLNHARGRFREVVLRTTPTAKLFYEHLGFRTVEGAPHHTHELPLPDTMEEGRRRSGVPHGVPPQLLMSESWMDTMIRDAGERGELANLPGKGKPLTGLNDDPDWWIKDKLRREGVSIVPPTMLLRQEVARFREEMPRLRTEEQ